jgi:hypothetical protein
MRGRGGRERSFYQFLAIQYREVCIFQSGTSLFESIVNEYRNGVPPASLFLFHLPFRPTGERDSQYVPPLMASNVVALKAIQDATPE